MTKRRAKNAKPAGANKSLGNALVNRSENRNTQHFVGAAIIPSGAKETPTNALASVTHENDYEAFFNNAELAGRDFTATKGDFKLLESTSSIVNVEDLQTKSFEFLMQKYGSLLRVPRRPPADSYSTSEGLETQENLRFMEWKKGLSVLTEGDGVVLTPFERNLEMWRQLWRVLERSDIVVQIVDARNPLLFRNLDLEKYVGEFDPPKRPILLLNKADLLTTEQLEIWRSYLNDNGVESIFWSAKPQKKAAEDEEGDKIKNDGKEAESDDDDKTSNDDEASDNLTDQLENATLEDDESVFIDEPVALLETLKQKYKGDLDRPMVVGMIGYPNVGKSSTINRIMGAKKTSVSATPGKTKHFQTLIVNEDLTLCDCPGLVMPSLGFSNSEMILNGILSVDQMIGFNESVELLCRRVPRRIFESMYSIMLPKPAEFEDPNRPANAHELLTTLAFSRGFMSAAGIPDCSRAARIILKDVFNGKLRWVAAPPGFSQTDFDVFTYADISTNESTAGKVIIDQLNRRNYLVNDDAKGRNLDHSFFGDAAGGVHIRSAKKPLESMKYARKKREKLRRAFAHLDA